MKIRIIVKSIVTAAIFIAIWCMTPPALPLAAKIILTGLFLIAYIILPAFIRKSPHSAQLDNLLRSLPSKILQFLCTAGRAIMHATKLFVGWIYEINIYAAESKCAQIYSATLNRNLCYDATSYGQHLRPVRRVARCLDFTAVCSSIAMCFAGGILCHYCNRPALIALLCVTVLSVLIFGAIADSSTFFLGDTPMSADPWTGTAAKIVQLIVLALQTFHPNTDTATSDPAYEPFFTVQIGSFSLGISPLWMVVIVSTILFLIGCTSIGTALHDLVESDGPTES